MGSGLLILFDHEAVGVGEGLFGGSGELLLLFKLVDGCAVLPRLALSGLDR